MRVQLVFQAWLGKDSAPLATYYGVKGHELELTDFHAGTTFQARIELDEDDTADLQAALAEGYKPVFYAVAVGPDDWRAEADASLSA